ncbi:MAG: hypothetical protein QM737_08825 [Ferruginibacter sp.]
MKFLLNITGHKPNQYLRYIPAFLFFSLAYFSLQAQVTVSGTVYDSSRINYVENVRVVSTGGLFTLTDSMGRYRIMVSENDSIFFSYNNKPTQKFAIKPIPDPSHFDISLRINVKGKYSVLKEVIVYSKSYRQDSLENRQEYADIYDYTRPGLSTSVSPGGGAGADINELINVFRFKRNKRLKAFQRRLEAEEREKYVNYRFSKITVRRITGLQGALLDTFLVWYRPDYEFARNSDELTFNQYVLQAFYQFQKLVPTSPAKKEENN